MGAFDQTNTAPSEVKLPIRTDVQAQSTSNVTLTNPSATLDGVNIYGLTFRAANGWYLLINGQSTAAENGLYMLDADTGQTVTVSGSFSAGSYTLSGLTIGKLYAVKVLAGVTLVSDGTNSYAPVADANGEYWFIIKASGTGTITFTGPTSGTASTYITVYGAKLTEADTPELLDYSAVGNWVYVIQGTTNKAKWYKVTAINGSTVTYTLQSNPPAEQLVQFTNRAPQTITI